MNWLIQPTDQINFFNFQLPQPQLLLFSSNKCFEQKSLEDEINQMEFSSDDFKSFWKSPKEMENECQIPMIPVVSKTIQLKKPKRRYQKNICGYIIKKALRAFVSDNYRNVVVETCAKHGAVYEEAQKLCMSRVETVYGPSHLKLLLVPDTREQIEVKKAITQFLEWFLAERYVRHLILDGKMEDKEKYILYKNKFFPKEIAKFKRMTDIFIASI